MPIYEYVCQGCGKLNEVIQKVTDPTPPECEGCHAKGTLQKVVSRSSFHLKGGGWYSDLYSSTKKDGASSSSSSASSSTSSTKSSSDSSSSSSGSSTSSTASSTSSAPIAAKSS